MHVVCGNVIHWYRQTKRGDNLSVYWRIKKLRVLYADTKPYAPITIQSNCETKDNHTQHTVGHNVLTQVETKVTQSEPLTIDNATHWYLHAQVENLKVPLLFDKGSHNFTRNL